MRLRLLQTARRARLHSLLQLQQHLLSKRALLARRQQHPLPRSALLPRLQARLLLRPRRPAAAGQAVEKRLTNERCAVPRHAVSKGGRSAAGAAAGAPCNRNKVYTGFAHECAVRRKCWHKVYTGDAKASEKFAHGAIRSRKSLHNRSKQ